jgi:hypothetical protein
MEKPPYYKPTKLLTTENHKTVKGLKKGVKTFILYLSSFKDNSKGVNVCSHASPGCAASCLVHSGFGGIYPHVAAGRRNKTEYFLHDRKGFMEQLDFEITRAKRLNKGKFKLAVRLNGTSDLRFENFAVRDGKNLFELHPDIAFYDYTKNHLRFNKILPKNYSLTFSRSETNGDHVRKLLDRGHNVAVVFDTLPKTYLGYPVINGDLNDLRFMDKKNVVVGLKYKKMTNKGATNVTNDFVVKTPSVSALQKAA